MDMNNRFWKPDWATFIVGYLTGTIITIITIMIALNIST